MQIRKNIALTLLFVATVYWAVWLGGYVFNALMVVPLWDHNMPDSMVSYFKTPHHLIYFFSAVNPQVFLASLVSWISMIKMDTAAKPWLGRATLIALLLIPLKVYMIILIGGLVDAALDGKFSPEMIATVNWWKTLNWGTIVAGTVVFIFHLLAVMNFRNPRRAK